MLLFFRGATQAGGVDPYVVSSHGDVKPYGFFKPWHEMNIDFGVWLCLSAVLVETVWCFKTGLRLCKALTDSLLSF